jgi:hypothetical protein
MDLLKWLGAGEEEETPRHGILSSRSEWHSLGIGASVGFIVAFVGGKDAAWLFIILSGVAFGSSETDIKQLQHIKREPYYALVASVVMFLLSAFLIIPRIPSGV